MWLMVAYTEGAEAVKVKLLNHSPQEQDEVSFALEVNAAMTTVIQLRAGEVIDLHKHEDCFDAG